MPSTSRHALTARIRPKHWVVWIAWGLLALWAVWWAMSFAQPVPKLIQPKEPPSSLWRYDYLGLDFIHNDAGERTWWSGVNPYLHLYGDPINPFYVCTPPTLLFFPWVMALPPEGTVQSHEHNALPQVIPYPFRAIVVWFVASVGMIVVATLAAAAARRRLGASGGGGEGEGLPLVPIPVMLVAMLFSYPVLFELERGNFNVLVLLFIALGCLPWLWNRTAPAGAPVAARRWSREIWAGICLGLAAALKVFPLILLPGLIVLRKFLAAIVMVATLLLLWLSMFHLTESWSRIAAAIAHEQANIIPVAMHSLSISWRHIWGATVLARVSPAYGSLALLAPPAAIVSWFVFRSPARNRLMYPYALWLAALGTCAMMIAVDYNLLLLVMATLIVWDRRDPLWLQLLLIPWLLVWQPFQLGPDSFHRTQWFAITLFAMKLWAMLAVGLLVIWRARAATAAERSASAAGAGVTSAGILRIR